MWEAANTGLNSLSSVKILDRIFSIIFFMRLKKNLRSFGNNNTVWDLEYPTTVYRDSLAEFFIFKQTYVAP